VIFAAKSARFYRWLPPNGCAPRDVMLLQGGRRSWRGKGRSDVIAAISAPRRAGRCGRWRSAAPRAAHALADALRALDDTASRNEAAHPAGEGRQASAIRARAAKIASANHLAVATDIEARGLRHEGRSG
jgi:hypothetical protein